MNNKQSKQLMRVAYKLGEKLRYSDFKHIGGTRVLEPSVRKIYKKLKNDYKSNKIVPINKFKGRNSHQTWSIKGAN